MIRWRRFIGRTVVVHLPEQTVEGVLMHAFRDVLVLRGAVLSDETHPRSLDGEVVIERSRIVFGQVI